MIPKIIDFIKDLVLALCVGVPAWVLFWVLCFVRAVVLTLEAVVIELREPLILALIVLFIIDTVKYSSAVTIAIVIIYILLSIFKKEGKE